MGEPESSLLNPALEPLVEVAVTIQFEPLDALKSAHIGLLWGHAYRKNLPGIEEHPPAPHVIELENPQLQSSDTPRIRISEKPEVPRFFFISESGDELIQVQNDRFSCNWRRRGDDYNYPRYPKIRDSLGERFAAFRSFVEREKLGEVSPNQVEIVYVNHILYGPGRDAHGRLGELIKPWSAEFTSLGGAHLQDVRIHTQHVLASRSGEFLGRLHVDVVPAYLKANMTPLYKIELAGRGKPIGGGVEGALGFLDFAHERLVAAFGELFSDATQNTWKGRHA